MDGVNAMWQRLDARDQELFFFDIRQMNWDTFMTTYYRGIRQYLLKDPLDTIPEALVRYNR